MIELRRYITLLFSFLGIVACQQSDEPAESVEDQQNNSFSIELNGTIYMPKWVDLEQEGRAFTLRHNEVGYPKIRLSTIEDDGAAYEPFPSSVWLYNNSLRNKVYDFRIDVEDYGGVVDNVEGTNKNYGSQVANRGVSRIYKKGDNYEVFVKYEVSGKQGQPVGYNKENYPATYLQGTKVFVAFNHHENTSVDGSAHRLYMPKVHSVLSNSTGAPVMDALHHIPGDFVVAESSHTKDASKRFKLPFISHYADLSTIISSTKAKTATNFYMAGVLLALKFHNQLSEEILIHNIYTKSNNLCYSGYYELWRNHKDLKDNTPSATHNRPFFARADGASGTSNRRKAVYTLPILSEEGGEYRLGVGERTAGRFYLWGAIDELSKGAITEVQIEYSLASSLDTRVKTKIINIAPSRTSAKKFEEGKAYLITLPIKQ